jgi:hypothetical protein
MTLKMQYGVFSSVAPCVSAAQAQLHDQWRSLWEQHVAWTRMTILAAAGNEADLQPVANRLLRNAADMGMLMSRYYGEAAGAQFTGLIHDHLVIALQLVQAAKAGDAAAAAQTEQAWYANADAIAAFLASINLNLPEAAVRSMLRDHLAMTKAEAVAILTGDVPRSIALYDQIEAQALAMADASSAAMARQFRL